MADEHLIDVAARLKMGADFYRERSEILETIIGNVLDALPQRRDWLDPDLESLMRAMVDRD